MEDLGPGLMREHVKIVIPLEADEIVIGSAETLWAIREGDGHYTVDNIPWSTRKISSDDVVSAEETGGQLIFESIVREGGHSTVRVMSREDAAESEREDVRAGLLRLGAESELYGESPPWLISVDVPATTSLRDVLDFLTHLPSDAWAVETGAISGLHLEQLRSE